MSGPPRGVPHELERFCLTRAREVLARAVGSLEADQPSPEALGQAVDFLDLVDGIFVTLHRDGELRGCIGFMDRKPGLPGFGECLEHAVVAAAQRDPRFLPVQSNELAFIGICVTFVGVLRELEQVEQIHIGRHGLVVQGAGRKGVLLPQVASERGWNTEQFLRATCSKAGLTEDAWKDAATQVHYFEAWSVSENQ